MLTSSALLAFLLSIVSAVLTAYDPPIAVKYTLAAIVGLASSIPLFINLIIFLRSPFSRYLHLKNEIYKLILCDHYESYSVIRAYKGDGIYCNQSMVPKSMMNPKSLLFYRKPPAPLIRNIQSDFYSKCTADIDGRKHTFRYNYYNSGMKLIGKPKINHSSKVNIMRQVGETQINCLYHEKSAVIVLKHKNGFEHKIEKKITIEKYFTLVGIICWHSMFPESGLVNFVSYRRNSVQLHSLYYQEILQLISTDKLKPGNISCLMITKPFCVEGENINLDELGYTLEASLPEGFDDKFGKQNRYAFCMHHVRFFGCINMKAIQSAIKRRTHNFYKKVSTNWKDKRYFVDIDYLLKKSGSLGLGCIDKKIKPTMIIRGLDNFIFPHIWENAYNYIIDKVEIHALKKSVLDDLKNGRKTPEKLLNLKLYNCVLRKRLKKVRTKDLKSLATKIVETRKNPPESETQHFKTPKLEGSITFKRDMEFTQEYQEKIDKMKSPYKDALLKTVEEYSKGKTVNKQDYLDMIKKSSYSTRNKLYHAKRFLTQTCVDKIKLDPVKSSTDLVLSRIKQKGMGWKKVRKQTKYITGIGEISCVNSLPLKNKFEILIDKICEIESEGVEKKSSVQIRVLPTIKRDLERDKTIPKKPRLRVNKKHKHKNKVKEMIQITHNYKDDHELYHENVKKLKLDIEASMTKQEYQEYKLAYEKDDKLNRELLNNHKKMKLHSAMMSALTRFQGYSDD